MGGSRRARPGNLPHQTTSFVGRVKELAEVKRLLSRARLVTLTGVGGCGKTRLALQAASEHSGAPADGIWWVELAVVSDPRLVPRAVAAALGVVEHSRQSVTETLTSYLRSRSMLLLLDNCEHVVSACARLADSLLQACPHMRILATSREPLGIPGEVVRYVPPLSIPGPQDVTPADGVASYDAVRLFVERARLSQPEFAFTSSNARPVVQICRRLDGIPLAIELAAARVKVLTVEQIAARLDDRFRLLTGGSRTALPRHSTLRAAIDWSYDLLTESERMMLGRMSVFAGGWTLEAAEATFSDQGATAQEALDLITGLANKSLILVEARKGEARYRLLGTIRQYGRDRLLEAGQYPRARQRHRDWCLDLTARAAREMYGRHQVAWIERLEIEHDNLRAALEWSKQEQNGHVASLYLSGRLWWFWHVRGYWSEGRDWLEEALSRGRDAPASARVDVIEGAEALAWRQGDYERAKVLCAEGLDLCHRLDNREGVARFLAESGLVLTRLGDFEQGLALGHEALGLSRDLADDWLISWALLQLGGVLFLGGDYPQAEECWKESLAIARTLEDRYRLALALRDVGLAMLYRGNDACAAEHFVESLALCREIGDRWVTEECLEGLAQVACNGRQYGRAARLFAAAESLREALGHQRVPQEQERHERTLAMMRTELDQVTFTTLWVEGRAMSLAQAIDYALMMEGTRVAQAAVPEGTAIARPPELLTPRQRTVAELVAQGLTNREIAARLGITERTAETHVQNILNKLGAHSRTQIAVWALEHRSRRRAPN